MMMVMLMLRLLAVVVGKARSAVVGDVVRVQ